MILLSACTSTQKPSAIRNTESPPLPAGLLTPCLPPLPVQPLTWQGLLIWNEQLLHTLEICNQRLKGIKTIAQQFNPLVQKQKKDSGFHLYQVDKPTKHTF